MGGARVLTLVDLDLVARPHDDTIAALKQNDRKLTTQSGRAAGDEPYGFVGHGNPREIWGVGQRWHSRAERCNRRRASAVQTDVRRLAARRIPAIDCMKAILRERNFNSRTTRRAAAGGGALHRASKDARLPRSYARILELKFFSRSAPPRNQRLRRTGLLICHEQDSALSGATRPCQGSQRPQVHNIKRSPRYPRTLPPNRLWLSNKGVLGLASFDRRPRRLHIPAPDG